MLQILTFLLALLHPYYVSVTEIKHNAKSQSLEVSCRLFSDDLEVALNKMAQGKVDILNPKNTNQNNELIARYVPQHLKITVNGKPLVLKFIGYEQESEATWCYFEVAGVRSAKNIGVSNDLLYAEHEEQEEERRAAAPAATTDKPERKAEFRF